MPLHKYTQDAHKSAKLVFQAPGIEFSTSVTAIVMTSVQVAMNSSLYQPTISSLATPFPMATSSKTLSPARSSLTSLSSARPSSIILFPPSPAAHKAYQRRYDLGKEYDLAKSNHDLYISHLKRAHVTALETEHDFPDTQKKAPLARRKFQ